MLPEYNSDISEVKKMQRLEDFVKKHPDLEIQDLYKWLYYGEFGPDENKILDPKERQREQLMRILDDLESECMKEPPPKVWDHIGMSSRFIMVYLSSYEKHECPMNRIINLVERAGAFVGSRMQFKLDWTFLKEHIMHMDIGFNKQDFTNFEDKIDFYQLPELSFSEKFNKNYTTKFRVLPLSLFFDYFPEFMDEEILKNISDKTHLFD